MISKAMIKFQSKFLKCDGLIEDLRGKFKACVPYFHHFFIFSQNDSPSKTIKNAFYFI